ncbi:MAG: glycosyl transferase family 36 [Armatimonadota bacterium]|nr:glycosyl transferase family 36 [Armatimonadota bacterium]
MPLEKYGRFSEDGKEFIITRPDTPAPWVNYISNTRYTGLVSHTGGGYSYWVDPRDSRITRHRYNSLPWDRPGRYVYVRETDGEFWSLSWQPVPKELDFYECRHGMGYTTISTRYRDLSGEITYLVPPDDDLEIWRVRLRNLAYEERRLSLFSYVELCLGHALVDLINQPNDQHFNIVTYDHDHKAIYATKNYWVTYREATVKQPNQAWDRYVFFTTSLPIVSREGSKDAFIGKWRSESNPDGVERGMLTDTDITAGDACAALHSEIVLEPREETDFVVLLGCVNADGYRETAYPLIRKYLDLANVESAREGVKRYWESYLSSPIVETPDPNMNLMLNVWAKRQAWVTFNMNRNAGYYHGGLLFGVGMRDSAQDMMGPLLAEPDAVADRLTEVLSHQFADGSTLHNYFKLTGHGEKTGHSDTPLWLPLAIMNYLKETGDFAFLERIVAYQDGGQGTVREHLERAIDYPLSNLTPNHLPKFGPGDWNDTLDYVGRKGIGESVWVAEFLCFILRETADLLDRLGDGNKAAQYCREYDLIADALNTRCWDGEWYIRGTRDDGGVIGSSRNTEGRIFMNAQSWAVISGVAPEDRARRCMDSAYRMLNTERGPQILAPAYRHPDPGVGLATRCVPGKKENGAIFNHVAAWAILGECVLGNGERAYEYHRKTMPMNQAYDPDLYKMEPYVYSEYVTSPEHETFGQASHSWLTGSAVWMLRGGLDYILGARPTYDGLLIDPCVPPAWDGYRITRRFRGAMYEIEVRNPNHVQRGVRRLEVDGREIPGRVLPIAAVGERVGVVCLLG